MDEALLMLSEFCGVSWPGDGTVGCQRPACECASLKSISMQVHRSGGMPGRRLVRVGGKHQVRIGVNVSFSNSISCTSSHSHRSKDGSFAGMVRRSYRGVAS